MAADRLETRIDPAVKQAAVDVARAQHRSLSAFVTVALEQAVREHERFSRRLRERLEHPDGLHDPL
jgi:hypothetical protein